LAACAAALAPPDSATSPLWHSHMSSGSSAGFTRDSASPTERWLVASDVTPSAGHDVFTANSSRSNSGERLMCCWARCSSQSRAVACAPKRLAASSTSATGLTRASGTAASCSDDCGSTRQVPRVQESPFTEASTVCCRSACLSCSGVSTREYASASCKATLFCLAKAIARSKDACLIDPDATCATPASSLLTLLWAKRT